MTLEIFFQKEQYSARSSAVIPLMKLKMPPPNFCLKVSRNLCLVSNTLAGNLVPRVCSLGETLAAAGHMSCPKFSARGGVGKVSNDINMLPVGYHV
jgi:hypothetical protein